MSSCKERHLVAIKYKKSKKGDRIPVKCNECICENGSWICTNDKCPGKCTFIGTDSVVTFDQMVYNFDADCSKYTLMHIPDHTIAVTLLNHQVKGVRSKVDGPKGTVFKVKLPLS